MRTVETRCEMRIVVRPRASARQRMNKSYSAFESRFDDGSSRMTTDASRANAREREPLPLTDRQIEAAELASDAGVVGRGQALHHLIDTRHPADARDLGGV